MSALRARRCAGCGAALPEPGGGQHVVTCRFCGLVSELPDRPPPIVVRWDLKATAQQLGRKFKFAMALGALVAAAVVAVSILRAVRPITEALDDISDQAKRFEESQKPVAVAALASLAPGERRVVDVAAPAGGFAQFDPVGQLGWAREIARAWVSDATVQRIEAAPIASSGVVDVSKAADANVSYRFVSPSRVAKWQREADERQNVEADYEIELLVTQATVMASVVRGRPLYVEVPQEEALLATKDLLARARKDPRFPDRPFYAGHVTHVKPEGWLWYFTTLSGRDQVPMVRARTGRLFP